MTIQKIPKILFFRQVQITPVRLTLFETEKCQKVLLAIDYTPFDNKNHDVREAVVTLNMDDVVDVRCDKNVLCGKEKGIVREIRFNVKPHESVFVELLTDTKQ